MTKQEQISCLQWNLARLEEDFYEAERNFKAERRNLERQIENLINEEIRENLSQ